MARYVRLFGLASLVIVDHDREIEALNQHPALERDFESRGPLVNRMIVSRLKRQFTLDNQFMLSMRPKGDKERQNNQKNLKEKLDRFADTKDWSEEAIAALVVYILTGKEKDLAYAALTYVTAYPFQTEGATVSTLPFDEVEYLRLFELYKRLREIRRPFSLRGMFSRMTLGTQRAKKQLLESVGGDENGLHALETTLDNSLPILENLRTLAQETIKGRKKSVPFNWVSIRTAPVIVLRQIKQDFTLPFVDHRVPPFTLVIMRMRDSVKLDSNAGFEFAAGHWSACPAHHYVLSLFETVWSKASHVIARRKKS